MRLLCLFLILLAPTMASDLIPNARKVTPKEGSLLVDVQTAVIAPGEFGAHAEVLATAIQKTTGFLHRIRTPEQVGQMQLNRAIRLTLDSSLEHPGSYRLQIDPAGVTLTAADRAGLMHGAQTFANLLPVGPQPTQRALIPAQVIEDRPETARRIFHLDVGAHLFPVEQMKSLIDWLSFHKLNELHLQFNNDHGWRLESEAHPKLHRIGGVRPSTPPYGDRTGSNSTAYRGYYPREKLRELIAHADSRAVTIVPSFSLTRGASAIIAAYPELGAEPVAVASTWEPREVGLLENESTLAFLDALFAEVAELFPATEIRIEGPQTAFHEKLKALLEKHQRSLLVPTGFATTDLSLYPRPADEELLVSSDREAEGGFNPVSRVYRLTPTPEGAQATLRTEFVHDFAKLQYLVFPRLAAFAEATWLPADQRDEESFKNRLGSLSSRYRASGVQASQPYEPPVAKALHGTVVTSTIPHRENHPPELVFDGRKDTLFWSRGGVETGDRLTLAFPWPPTGEVTVETGQDHQGETILEEGVLEFSEDGDDWQEGPPVIAGKATAEVPRAVRFLRLRATGPQDHPLVLAEISLSPPLLTPLHEESREIQLPVARRTTTLGFKADFRDHPDLRDEIETARQVFFSQWVPLAQKIGVSHLPGTPRVFEIQPGEPGEMTDEEVEAWMVRRMIPWLQDYPVSAPLWFTTGFTALLLEEFPDRVDPAKFQAGGPQSAAFLKWLSETFGENVVIAVSQDCQRDQYRPGVWKTFTRQSLEDLGRLYQEKSGK